MEDKLTPEQCSMVLQDARDFGRSAAIRGMLQKDRDDLEEFARELSLVAKLGSYPKFDNKRRTISSNAVRLMLEWDFGMRTLHTMREMGMFRH